MILPCNAQCLDSRLDFRKKREAHSSSTYHSSLIFFHRKDCPHLSVVSMQSSFRLRGSLCHSEVLRAIALEDELVRAGGKASKGAPGVGRRIQRRVNVICLVSGSTLANTIDILLKQLNLKLQTSFPNFPGLDCRQGEIISSCHLH